MEALRGHVCRSYADVQDGLPASSERVSPAVLDANIQRALADLRRLAFDRTASSEAARQEEQPQLHSGHLPADKLNSRHNHDLPERKAGKCGLFDLNGSTLRQMGEFLNLLIAAGNRIREMRAIAQELQEEVRQLHAAVMLYQEIERRNRSRGHSCPVCRSAE